MRHEESTKVILHEVWPELERIRPGRDRAAGVSLSLLQARDQVVQAAGQFLGSRTAPPVLSAAMAVSIYGYCAPLAYIEREGKTAYGGECLAALAAGFFIWQAVSQWGRRRRGRNGT